MPGNLFSIGFCIPFFLVIQATLHLNTPYTCHIVTPPARVFDLRSVLCISFFPPLTKCDADERSAKRTPRNALSDSRTNVAGCAGGDLHAAKRRGVEEGQAGQEGCPPGAAIEVDFEVAVPAISVIISVIIATIIINAVTRSCLASGAACHCPFSSPSSPSSTSFLLLLWSHNCQRNKFSILLKHHLHYKCNAVKAKQRSRQISLNWSPFFLVPLPLSCCNSISVWPRPQHN